LCSSASLRLCVEARDERPLRFCSPPVQGPGARVTLMRHRQRLRGWPVLLTASILVVTAGAARAATVPVEECVHLALGRAPSAQAALADVAAANAGVRAARAAYWPRLQAQAQYGHSEGYDVVVTNGGVTALGVGIEAPLLDGGLRDAELDAARARLRSATA